MTKPDVLVGAALAGTIARLRKDGDIDGFIAAEMECRGWTRDQVARGFEIADWRDWRVSPISEKFAAERERGKL